MILVFVAAAAAVRYEIRDVDKTFREGQTAYQERRFEDVVRVFTEYLKEDSDRPKVATAWLQLATAYSELKRPELAIDAFETLHFNFPNIDYGAHVFFHLARNYAAIGDVKRASDYGARLEKGYPDSSWAKRLHKENPELIGPPSAASAPAS
jgi:TolA-binding protein